MQVGLYNKYLHYNDASVLRRTSRQDSSKYSPFQLMYKREPRLPIEVTTLSFEGSIDGDCPE